MKQQDLINIIIEEVYKYGNALSDKPRITVLNKIENTIETITV